MNIPLLDLVAQYRSIKPEVDAAVQAVFDSQYFIMGPEVTDCERSVADYSRCAHAVGVSSGTDALLMSLMAEEIGAGDEVITTPYTFFATAGSIARTGARPVFVDIDPVTFNLHPAQIEAKITERTKAIMVVHLYGLMADMHPIMETARRHNLVVIEDAAQAIGAEYKGHRAGSIADYGCFSFFPSKNLGGAGDGGMVVTQDPARADRLTWLRNHGMNPKYHHKYIGGNFRLDSLQAAVVNVKLRYLDQWTRARQSNARRYVHLLEQNKLSPEPIQVPWFPRSTDPSKAEGCGCRHIFNQFVIRVKNRDGLRAYLAEHGIGTEIYYPIPLHRQECFSYLGCGEGDYPESERAAQETMALPIYPELTDEQAVYVVRTIASSGSC